MPCQLAFLLYILGYVSALTVTGPALILRCLSYKPTGLLFGGAVQTVFSLYFLQWRKNQISVVFSKCILS